jgi:hypothetical protein
MLEGEARAGSFVVVELGGLRAAAPLVAAEIIHVTHDGRDYLGLVFGYEEPADLEFWSAMRISGESLEIVDAESSRGP